MEKKSINYYLNYYLIVNNISNETKETNNTIQCMYHILLICQQIPLNIDFLNKYIISRLKIGNKIFHSFLKHNILSLPIVYGTIRECGLELRSSHKCFFVADYLDVGFSIRAMSDYV